MRFLNLIFSICLFILLSVRIEGAGMEKIEIAPDNWTFRTAETKKIFIPYGTSFTAIWGSWPPDYFNEKIWDEEKFKNDLDKIKSFGMNIVRVIFPYKRILPDPQEPENVRPSEKAIEILDRMLEIASQRSIRLIVGLEPTWYGFPEWYEKGGAWYGPVSHQILSEFWKIFATRYRDDGRIFSFTFSNETVHELSSEWSGPNSLPAWRKWAKKKYEDINIANKNWGTTYKNWDEVKAPGFDGKNSVDWKKFPEGTDENENKTNDNMLYDFLLFREFTAFLFSYIQTQAIKSVDSSRLTSIGLVQWNPLLREIWETNEGVIRGPEHNAKEIAKSVDYVSIHFYPVYPDANDFIQLMYLELWARYAYAGKPVILEEFNAGPEEKNSWWVEQVINQSKNFVSGWLVWTYQNIPESDSITEVCGLIDENGEETMFGTKSAKISNKIKKWNLKRKPASKIVEIDKKWLYTSSKYRDLIEGLLFGKDAISDIDFKIESNQSIDDYLKESLTRK